MRNIVIVCAESTGKNYIGDILKRNYHPVILDKSLSDKAEPTLLAERAAMRKKYAGRADFCTEQQTYEETLEMIRAFDPLHVIPGSECGVDLAFHLAEDLGLPSNPYKNIDCLIHKDAMHEALKKYGIRYIRGDIVHSVEQAVKYYRDNDFHGCVIKPVRGAGTVGVHLCDNEEEMVTALKEEFGNYNMFGEKFSILLQERIFGTEYIVNTVSRGGKHRLSSIWRYNKKRVRGGGNVYDYCETIGQLEAGHTRMVRYAFDVADAIGFQNGAIHGEYMLDDKGPILIEVNCRVMGASLPEDFDNRIFGHHETDNCLDSYLDPDYHDRMLLAPYRTYAKGYIKLFINPEDVSLDFAPIVSIVKHLRSFNKAIIGSALTGQMKRTVDMETAGGTVYLVNEDETVLNHDLEFLRKVEQEYFGMLFSKAGVDVTKKPQNMETLAQTMARCRCDRSVLLLTNDPDVNVNATIIKADGDRNVSGEFNWAVLDYRYKEGIDLEQMIEDFYLLASKVQRGGHIVVPESTYWHFPCGIESIEVLCESIGLLIEAPTAYSGKALIATVTD